MTSPMFKFEFQSFFYNLQCCSYEIVYVYMYLQIKHLMYLLDVKLLGFYFSYQANSFDEVSFPIWKKVSGSLCPDKQPSSRDVLIMNRKLILFKANRMHGQKIS